MDAQGGDEDEGADPCLKTLATRFERDGIDTAFLAQPFLESSELGDASSVRQKLAGFTPDDKRAFVKSVDQHGCSALILAVRRGDAEVADVLLDAGANPNDADTSGVTALHYAVSRGAVATTQLLINRCADVVRSDDSGDTPLIWARGCGVIQCLLSARADAHSKNAHSKTALMCASASGDLPAVEVLAVVPGMEIDARDDQGRSAHDVAIASGHADVCELLERLGAKAAPAPADRMIHRDEALHEAARRGDADTCARVLQQNGDSMDVDAEIAGETALLLACGVSHGRTVEVLVAARADPNHADAFLKETPLMRAVLAGCSNELLWLLLEARANPALEDLTGRTPASVAAAWGHSNSVEILEAAASGKLGFASMD